MLPVVGQPDTSDIWSNISAIRSTTHLLWHGTNYLSECSKVNLAKSGKWSLGYLSSGIGEDGELWIKNSHYDHNLYLELNLRWFNDRVKLHGGPSVPSKFVPFVLWICTCWVGNKPYLVNPFFPISIHTGAIFWHLCFTMKLDKWICWHRWEPFPICVQLQTLPIVLACLFCHIAGRTSS